MATDPARAAKVSASLKRRAADPAIRQKMRVAARKGALTKDERYPNWREEAGRILREIAQPISVATGANVAGRDFAAMHLKGLEARWAWCPPEYRELARELTTKGCKAADVRAAIANQVKSDEAKLSPFERQELALKRGAKLVANDHGPSLSNPANYGEERWSYGRSHG